MKQKTLMFLSEGKAIPDHRLVVPGSLFKACSGKKKAHKQVALQKTQTALANIFYFYINALLGTYVMQTEVLSIGR